MQTLRRWAHALGFTAVELELLSPLPLAECCSRLRAALSPGGSLLIAGPIIGDLTGTRLRARKHIVRRGGFQAYLTTDLIDATGQTRIMCRVTTSWWDFCFFGALMAVLTTQSVAVPIGPSTFILPSVLLVGFAVLNMLLHLMREERRFLVDFVRSVVDAREVKATAASERYLGGVQSNGTVTPP